MTPEGLNSRLTFLNQCVRPGESIPVIGDKGQIVANDALNTSFGAPPVLVLRIGDFYNGKIIPRSIGFSYEPLVFDMNPEGIGIQPMIANVTMQFDMIGGMGLEKPVEELQNALSFNYYANTEIYDERAKWTDDSWKKLDKEYFQSLIDEQPTLTVAQVDNQQTNTAGETIGQIQTTVNGVSGQTGDITYMKIMDTLLDVTKEYYTNIVNQGESMTKSYNNGIWQLISKERQYTDGISNFNIDNLPPSFTVNIFGKSVFESRIDELFNKTIEDVDNNSNFIILGLIAENFNDATLRSVKTNLKTYLTNYKTDFSLGVSTIVSNVVQQQVDMVQVFRKINFVTTLSDGVIIDSKPKIYNISGTTEIDKSSKPIPLDTYDELSTDYKSVSNNLNKFNQYLIDKSIIYNGYNEPGGFNPTSTVFELTDLPGKRFFMVMSQIFDNSDDFNTFKTSIITNDMDKSTPNLLKSFNKIVNKFQDKVKIELKEEEKFYKTFKKSNDYKNYLVVENLYKKGKTRKFNYTTEPSSKNVEQTKNLFLLYQGKNDGDKIIWTDKTQFN
jgi:hypothetical protein